MLLSFDAIVSKRPLWDQSWWFCVAEEEGFIKAFTCRI